MKLCLRCSEPITQRTSRATFCSRRCKSRYRNAARTFDQRNDYQRRRAASTAEARAIITRSRADLKAVRYAVERHMRKLEVQQQRKAARPKLKPRAKIQQHIAAYKTARGCQVCGIAAPAYILDMHHIDPATKAFQLSRAKSYRLVDLELAKCAVLCAIHHRMVEAGDVAITPKEA